MSKETAGLIIEYIKKDDDNAGKMQIGIARYADQLPEFEAAKKVLVCLCKEDMSLETENGKEKKVLKSATLLKVIGFVD